MVLVLVSNVALPVFYFFCFRVVDATDHKDGKRAARIPEASKQKQIRYPNFHYSDVKYSGVIHMHETKRIGAIGMLKFRKVWIFRLSIIRS